MSQIHRQMLQKALAAHQQGQLAVAIQQYNAVLALDSGNFDALQLKGLALYQSGDARTAVELLTRAIRKNSSMASVFNNRGLALQALGQRREALQDFSKAVALQPQYAEAHGNRANVLCELGRLAEAAEAGQAAIRINPQVPQFHNSLGVIRKEQNDLNAALALFDSALRLNPRYFDAVLNRANALLALRRADEALTSYARAIALQPGNARAHGNLGNALGELHRLDEALASHDRAVSLAPASAEAHCNRAAALMKMARFEDALASAEKAVALKPDHAEAHVLRAGLLKDMGRLDAALAAAEAAVTLAPGLADGWSNRARILRELRRLEEALASAEKAIALKPEHAEAHLIRSATLRDLMRPEEATVEAATYLRLAAGGDAAAQALAEDWSRLLTVDAIPAVYETEEELRTTRERIESTLDGLLARQDSPLMLSQEQRDVAAKGIAQLTGFYLAYHQENDRATMRKLSTVAGRLLGIAPYAPQPSRGGRMRVGIASQRLRNHNGANWAYNWFARLPRGDYEFFTYNFEALEDDLSAKFAGLGTHRQMGFSAAAEPEILRRMREDRLDALMLTDVGMTAVSRFLSLHRIAPCQFTAWGHPVTSGAPEIDYYLSSDLMEPPDAGEHYTETLVRLPNLALYLDEPRETVRTEKNFGLPEGRVLYGCLQSLYKYLPRYDMIYPLIARDVPDALFVFLEGQTPGMTAILQRRLERAFAAEGLEAARHVLLLPRQSESDYDSLMRQMHVNIDSIGWSGGNTSLKSIAFGVPLLTLPGRFMRGRHSSAMFAMMGVDELTAVSTEDYVSRLVAVGRDQDRRRHVSELLRANSPRLYRDENFTAAFDAFLKGRARPAIAG